MAGGLLIKVAAFFWGLGQSMWAMAGITRKVLNAFQRKVRGLSGLEYELQVERDRRADHWREGRSAVRDRRAGRSVGRAVNRRVMGASLRWSAMGTRALRLFSLAWRGVGRAAGWAKTVLGGVFRGIAGGWRVLVGALAANPWGLVIRGVVLAIGLLLKNKDSLMWFFGDLQANIMDFGAAMREVQKDIEATIESASKAVGAGYSTVRTWTSDMIEKGANWWKGTSPVRADAPVMTRRQLAEAAVPPGPSLPALPKGVPRGAGAVSHQDNSTTTIHINQQPGEDSSALARRTAQELDRLRQTRQRGLMYDAAPAF